LPPNNRIVILSDRASRIGKARKAKDLRLLFSELWSGYARGTHLSSYGISSNALSLSSSLIQQSNDEDNEKPNRRHDTQGR
jgi:hypothetical protein